MSAGPIFTRQSFEELEAILKRSDMTLADFLKEFRKNILAGQPCSLCGNSVGPEPCCLEGSTRQVICEACADEIKAGK